MAWACKRSRPEAQAQAQAQAQAEAQAEVEETELDRLTRMMKDEVSRGPGVWMVLLGEQNIMSAFTYSRTVKEVPTDDAVSFALERFDGHLSFKD